MSFHVNQTPPFEADFRDTVEFRRFLPARADLPARLSQ